MPGGPVGKGTYELELDTSKIKPGVAAADAIIEQSGSKAEAVFAKSGSRIGSSLANGVKSATTPIRAAIDSIGSGFSKISKSQGAQAILGGVGLGAGIGLWNQLGQAVGTATDFVIGSAKAFQDDQASQASLRASLQANVKAWDGNTDAIEAVIASRMKLGFADDDQRASLASLIGITHDATKALDLNRTAMDLARLRHIDLAAASDIVGKVYGGNIGILSRYGIVIDKNASSTEALATIQKLAGGQAEAYAKTDLGQAEAATIRLGEAQETLGATMSKIQTAVLPLVADAVEGVVDAFVAAGPAIGAVGDAVRFMLSPLASLNDLLAPMGGIVGALAAAFDAAGKAMGLVGDAAAFIASPLGNLNDVMGAIPVPWHNATEAMVNDLVKVQVAATKTPEAIEDDLRESASHLYAGAPKIGAAAHAGITDPIVDAGEDAKAGASKAAKETPEAIRASLISGWDKVHSAGEALTEALKNPVSKMKRIAQLEADLASKKMAQGLRSGDPLARAAAEDWRSSIEDELARLRGETYTYGKGAGKNFSKGMLATVGNARDAARLLSGAVSDNLRVRSPAKEGPMSEGGGPEGWGAKFAELYAGGMERGRRRVAGIAGSAAGDLAAMLAPSRLRGGTLGPVAALGVMGGPSGFSSAIRHDVSGTVRLTIDEATARALRAAGYSPKDIAGLVDASGFVANLRHVASMG